jgi:N-acetylmuramoyl-L-alanine amidase
MIMKIIDHRLYKDDGTPYPFRPSPNIGGRIIQTYLVMHYTASRDVSSAVNALTNPAIKASAHVVVGRDGSITQLVPFDTQAWHAGQSSWKELSGLNQYSIGIEIDNAGLLNRKGNSWVAWFGDVYSNDQVIEAEHKNSPGIKYGWPLYTPEQLFATLELAALLVQCYKLKDVLGHDDIAPKRKTDPGPAFPMETFRARLFGGRDSDEGIGRVGGTYVTTDVLNIRSRGDQNSPLLTIAPLPKGTRVKIVTSPEGWWKEVEVLNTIKGVNRARGWIHSRYISPV